MGRHSRSRKVQQKKRDASQPVREKFEDDEPVGGSLMNMRSGFKNLAGTGEEEEQGSKGSMIGWIGLALLVLAIIMFFAR